MGFAIHGPYTQGSFLLSDRLFGTGKTLAIAAQKTAFNQLVCVPPFLTIVFGALGALEGLSTPQIEQKLRQGLPSSFAAHCTVWPAALVFMFAKVPSHLRVVFGNSVALVSMISFLSPKCWHCDNACIVHRMHSHPARVVLNCIYVSRLLPRPLENRSGIAL